MQQLSLHCLPEAEWRKWMRVAGCNTTSETIETNQLEPGMYRMFVGKKRVD